MVSDPVILTGTKVDSKYSKSNNILIQIFTKFENFYDLVILMIDPDPFCSESWFWIGNPVQEPGSGKMTLFLLFKRSTNLIVNLASEGIAG